MRVARSVVSCFALFLTAALCVSSAIAQTSETGLPPFGSFQGGKFDLVSLENGNLHIEMPIYSVHQRPSPTKPTILYTTSLAGKLTRVRRRRLLFNG